MPVHPQLKLPAPNAFVATDFALRAEPLPPPPPVNFATDAGTAVAAEDEEAAAAAACPVSAAAEAVVLGADVNAELVHSDPVLDVW